MFADTRSRLLKSLAVVLLLPVFSHAAGFEEAGAGAAKPEWNGVLALFPKVDAADLADVTPQTMLLRVSLLPPNCTPLQHQKFEAFQFPGYPGTYVYLDPRMSHVMPELTPREFQARGIHPVLSLPWSGNHDKSEIRLPAVESIQRIAALFDAGYVDQGYAELKQAMDGASKGPLELDDPERTAPFEQRFALVPAGRSNIGGKKARVGPVLLQKWDVTQREFEEVMGRNPSYFNLFTTPEGVRPSPDRPVERVSFWDAVEYANARSKAEGKPLFYKLTDILYGPDGEIQSAHVSETGEKGGYYIPSLAELVHASRPLTDNFSGVFSWSRGNSDEVTQPVATRYPVPSGHYDLLGNVWKRTSTQQGEQHLLHGGAWDAYDARSRPFYSLKRAPDYRRNTIGIRLALSIP